MERDFRHEEIHAEFDRDYTNREPFRKFIYMSGLTKRYMVEWYKKGSIGFPNEVLAELVKAGEDPFEAYIGVQLRRTLPEDLTLPSDYKSLKVDIMSVGGELDLAKRPG